MKARIAVTALCLLLAAPVVALAQSAGDTAPKDNPPTETPAPPSATPAPPPATAQPKPNPGSIRVTTKAPEPDKWYAQNFNNGQQRIFKCKPLACPDPQSVVFIFGRSPTRHPDPKALERFAKEELPKSIRAASAAREVMSDGAEKAETLASDTATLKGYPAVTNETKLSRAKTETYVETAIVFAGAVMIRIQSQSTNRELAKKALTEFIDVMRIEEGPPAVVPGQRGT